MMRLGGCGAEVACDASIYLAKRLGFDVAYPFDLSYITKYDYIRFSKIMRRYLWPRIHGINKASSWIEGYSEYLEDRGIDDIGMSELEGARPYGEAEAAVRRQIDGGILIPDLTLYHMSEGMKDYRWHWFIINGYSTERKGHEGRFMVKAVTYSEYEWIDFAELWNTGYKQRGGLVLLDVKQQN